MDFESIIGSNEQSEFLIHALNIDERSNSNGGNGSNESDVSLIIHPMKMSESRDELTMILEFLQTLLH